MVSHDPLARLFDERRPKRLQSGEELLRQSLTRKQREEREALPILLRGREHEIRPRRGRRPTWSTSFCAAATVVFTREPFAGVSSALLAAALEGFAGAGNLKKPAQSCSIGSSWQPPNNQEHHGIMGRRTSARSDARRTKVGSPSVR